MDQREHIPVAGDLLLGAVAWSALIGHQRFDASPRRANVLDRVGGLRALDQGDLTQRLKAHRVLTPRDVLATARLGDARQRRDGARVERPEAACKILEAAHHQDVLLTPDEHAV
jgi:hypothetical protein